MVYSAIFAAHPDSATVIVRDKIMDGTTMNTEMSLPGPRM